MKNLLLFIVICCSLISCNNEGGGLSATAKKNLEVNDSIMKAYEAGDFSKMGDYIAADAVDHGSEKGDVKGLDSIVADMKRYHEQMPDMKASMTTSLANDEYVFTWSKVSGTMNGTKTEMSSVDVSKYKDGKAIEHWIYMDPKDMAMMMPTMPQESKMPADTLKK
ncbi:MAG: nuclear transport factor 2 family protein [Chitinophagaceae bacterium]